MDEKKLRRRRGKTAAFTPLQQKAFAAVLSFASEIYDAAENRSLLRLSVKEMTKLDYLISTQMCAEKNLTKSLLKYWARLLRGEEIGVGSRNLLIAKLGPLFCSREYALFPMARFFCPAEAWKEQVLRKQANLLAMKQDPVISLPPKHDDGVRRYGPEGIWVNAEVMEAPVTESQDEQDDGRSFDRQELSAVSG